MSNLRGDYKQKRTERVKKNVGEISSLDIVALTFKLLFQRIQDWIPINFWAVIYSVGLITAPSAKVALFHTTTEVLRDPGGSRVKILKEMKAGIKHNFWKAMLITVIKWAMFVVISIAIFFWVSQETWPLRVISILPFYGLTLWWISVGYIYPIIVDEPDLSCFAIIKRAFVIGFTNPFKSLLFALIGTLLLILGIIFLGPILLIIPAARSILFIHGYWFSTGQEIPGLIDVVEYVNDHKSDYYFNERGDL